jgi:predicted RNA-binding Zn ribbon-like protein
MFGPGVSTITSAASAIPPSAPHSAALLHQHLAAAAAYPRLTDHDDEGWHLHYRDEDQGLPHVLEAVISVGTALHLTTRGMHRLHRCDAGNDPGDPCRNVVVDVTRNGRQRYCSQSRHRTATAPASR